MTNDKTIKQWFEWAKELGFLWADLALQTSTAQNTLDNTAPSLCEAIYQGFDWDSTEYKEKWAKLYIHLKNISNQKFI